MQDPKIRFILHLLAAMCERPQNMAFRVDGQTITLRVWRRDQARLVGQAGRNILAIRQFVREFVDRHVVLLEPDEAFNGITWTGEVRTFQDLAKELAALSPTPARVEIANEGSNYEVDIVGGTFGNHTKNTVNQLVHAIGKAHKLTVEVIFDGI